MAGWLHLRLHADLPPTLRHAGVMAVETRTFIIQIHDSSFLPTPYTVGPTAYD